MTKPATDAAKAWSGWGTALKPAHEPIVVARKPLDGTVAANVLEHGTGALNIDGCRVAGAPPSVPQPSFNSATGRTYGMKTGEGRNGQMSFATGRWPPNIVFAHLPECEAEACAEGCAVAELEAEADGASRFFPAFRYQAKASRRERDEGLDAFPVQRTGGMSATVDGSMKTGSGNDRVTAGKNIHPTVKPVELMRWLVRLVTPRNGLVLDPFAGSGTTGVAALLEGFRFVGCEREAEYVAIAKARLTAATDAPAKTQPVLFDLTEVA